MCILYSHIIRGIIHAIILDIIDPIIHGINYHVIHCNIFGIMVLSNRIIHGIILNVLTIHFIIHSFGI